MWLGMNFAGDGILMWLPTSSFKVAKEMVFWSYVKAALVICSKAFCRWHKVVLRKHTSMYPIAVWPAEHIWQIVTFIMHICKTVLNSPLTISPFHLCTWVCIFYLSSNKIKFLNYSPINSQDIFLGRLLEWNNPPLKVSLDVSVAMKLKQNDIIRIVRIHFSWYPREALAGSRCGLNPHVLTRWRTVWWEFKFI